MTLPYGANLKAQVPAFDVTTEDLEEISGLAPELHHLRLPVTWSCGASDRHATAITPRKKNVRANILIITGIAVD